MRFGLAARVALAMASILVIGVVMTGALSVYKFERTLAELLNSRFQFVVGDIRDRIEIRMDIGLALEDLEGVSEELEDYLRAGPEILSIEVFDETGTVLFSSDSSLVGDLVSEHLVDTWRENRGKDWWFDLESDAGIVGVPIRNNLSQDVGSLVLRYSREFLDQSVSAQTNRLFFIGSMTVLAMIILSLLGSVVLLRRSTRDLHNLDMAFNDIAMRRYDSYQERLKYIEHEEFPQFSASVQLAHEELDTATEKIRKLDEEAAI